MTDRQTSKKTFGLTEKQLNATWLTVRSRCKDKYSYLYLALFNPLKAQNKNNIKIVVFKTSPVFGKNISSFEGSQTSLAFPYGMSTYC